MVSADDQRESDLQVCIIICMLGQFPVYCDTLNCIGILVLRDGHAYKLGENEN